MRVLKCCATATFLVGVTFMNPLHSRASEESGLVELNEELRGIREALVQLVALHKSNDRYQQVELTMARIDLWVRRLAPLEAKLTAAEAQIDKDEKNLQALDRMQEQQDAYLQEQIREGSDTPRSETRMMLEDIERSRTGYEESQEDAGLRVQDYQNELATGYKAIAILDEKLIELLESGDR